MMAFVKLAGEGQQGHRFAVHALGCKHTVPNADHIEHVPSSGSRYFGQASGPMSNGPVVLTIVMITYMTASLAMGGGCHPYDQSSLYQATLMCNTWRHLRPPASSPFSYIIACLQLLLSS
jgi:hypothetical protein